MYTDKPETGRQAIQKYTARRMSTRPEFYSGRGVTTTDLNVKLLTLIDQGLTADFGNDVHLKFCQFLEALSDLSATNFLNQFYCWFGQWELPTGLRETDIDVGPDDGHRETIAFCTVLGVRGRGADPDRHERASLSLKLDFFNQVGYHSELAQEQRHHGVCRNNNCCDWLT